LPTFLLSSSASALQNGSSQGWKAVASCGFPEGKAGVALPQNLFFDFFIFLLAC
jgi:hypothetical protein